MNIDVIPVFVGPSLPPPLRPDGPFKWLPPAKAGDAAKLLESPPKRLCLIDGLFDSCPAPWHKELMMLMARGTCIFGAASMGALRAAELSPFGMIGVGAIFRAYAENRLHGDDEVALIHATERLGWVPLSIPMVEFRATLVQACRIGLLNFVTARRLRTVAHSIHFSDRDWPTIERRAELENLANQSTMAKLKEMHIPLKRSDAWECLRQALKPVQTRVRAPAPPLTCFVRALLDPQF